MKCLPDWGATHSSTASYLDDRRGVIGVNSKPEDGDNVVVDDLGEAAKQLAMDGANDMIGSRRAKVTVQFGRMCPSSPMQPRYHHYVMAGMWTRPRLSCRTYPYSFARRGRTSASFVS